MYASSRVNPCSSTSQAIMFRTAFREPSIRSGSIPIVPWYGPGLPTVCGTRYSGPPIARSLRRMRSVASIPHSIAVTQTSPSPWAACGSPHEKSAPSHQTGSQSVEPAIKWRQSTFPPPLCGGNGSKRPGSSVGTPMVPRNG